MENKPKKNIFEIIVYILNFIAIIIMLINIFNAFVTKECNNDSYAYEEKMQFNSRFYVYAGEAMPGSQIKQLIEIVNANNVQNDGTEYVVSINERKNENQYQFNNLKLSKRYIVEFEKQDGIVSNINIYTRNDNKNNVNTNNNEKEFVEITGFKKEGTVGKVIKNNTKSNDRYKINIANGITNLISYLPIIFLYIIVIAYKKRISKKYTGEENQYKLDKTNTTSLIEFLIIDICLIIYSLFCWNNNYYEESNVATVEKPIIYIYPEEATEVTVQLGKSENLTCTYPIYKEKWKVTAEPNGTLKDNETGKTYYALYWEGKNIKKYTDKLKEGFIVKGEDTVKFLEEKLAILGLNEKESEEFIIYWLPKMQNNKYNYIRFQTQEEINENMPLEITPNPETIIRVMMEWKGLNEYEDIEEQKLEKVERKGYTVVEWGGTEIK